MCKRQGGTQTPSAFYLTDFSVERFMLNWVITFFILAVVAALLGFGGMAGAFSQIAQFLAVLFVVLFVIGLVYSMVTGRRINPPL
jgi:uncharacterized membrane protein YtjA (UPF0391 family)